MPGMAPRPPGIPAPPAPGSAGNPGAPPAPGSAGNPGAPPGPGNPGAGGGCEKPRNPRSGEAPPGGGVPAAGGSLPAGRCTAACPNARKRNIVRTAKLGRARSLGGRFSAGGGPFGPAEGAGRDVSKLLFGPTAGARTPGGGGGRGLTIRGGSSAPAPTPGDPGEKAFGPPGAGFDTPVAPLRRAGWTVNICGGSREDGGPPEARPSSIIRSTMPRSSGGSSCLACQASSERSFSAALIAATSSDPGALTRAMQRER
jgi:hypothetical protein